MAVHVGELHTELSSTGAAPADDATAAGSAMPPYPGAREDEWRHLEAAVMRSRTRVRSEGFDD